MSLLCPSVHPANSSVEKMLQAAPHTHPTGSQQGKARWDYIAGCAVAKSHWDGVPVNTTQTRSLVSEDRLQQPRRWINKGKRNKTKVTQKQKPTHTQTPHH